MSSVVIGALLVANIAGVACCLFIIKMFYADKEYVNTFTVLASAVVLCIISMVVTITLCLKLTGEY